MITKPLYLALKAVADLDDFEAQLLVERYLNLTAGYITPAGCNEMVGARNVYADKPIATNEAEYRILKRVTNCRRANPHLNFNQALEVVIAADNLHRDDQLRDLTIMIEGLRAELRAF